MITGHFEGGITYLDEPLPGTEKFYWLTVYTERDRDVVGIETAITYPGGFDGESDYDPRVVNEKIVSFANTPDHWKDDYTQHVQIAVSEDRKSYDVVGTFAVGDE